MGNNAKAMIKMENELYLSPENEKKLT